MHNCCCDCCAGVCTSIFLAGKLQGGRSSWSGCTGYVSAEATTSGTFIHCSSCFFAALHPQHHCCVVAVVLAVVQES